MNDKKVAGIVLYISQGRSLREALQFGVACGTAATLSAGTALCNREDVERLYGLITDKNVKK